MKKLIFTLAMTAGLSAFAATSPYQGSEPAEGKFYLYQVETGRWLQPNFNKLDAWTTHAELGEVGFDVELRKLEGFEGYQIYCDFTANGELNGSDEDRFYLDQGDRALCDWIFEPTEGGYKIMIKAKPEARDRDRIAHDTYIGARSEGDFGGLSDNPEYFTWQLVSREERLEKMVADVVNGPVDASWLIPWNDLGRNDRRADRWSKDVQNPSGGGLGFDGSWGYPIQEYWHEITMRKTITLTDLPEGTYSFSVQAYYRDGDINEDAPQKRINGEEVIRARYFAGATSAPVMSIFDQAKNAEEDGFHKYVDALGVWVPDAMDQAARAMFHGNYINEYIKAPVSDGTLVIGLEKPEAVWHDWLIEKRYFLCYESTEVTSEDLTEVRNELASLIEQAQALPQVAVVENAIAAAQYVLENATTSNDIMAAINELQVVISTIRAAADDIRAFFATQELFSDDEAEAQFNAAVTRDDYANAIRTLRYARRRAAADKHEDVFAGNEPAEGFFYIYNVGQKQFLQGGSDWGAHAALGFPGIEIELKVQGTNGNGDTKYLFDTKLNNGGENQYMNYRGYMDCPPVDGFTFVPVEGRENTYYIVQGDYTDVHVEWNPYGSVDAGQSDETNVCTESRNLDKANENAMWKLVTREERIALLEHASEENPVDATIFISNPGFNQRASVDNWATINFSFWGRGGNYPDFTVESWNSNNAELSTMIEGLPEGKYVVSVQGFYRNGTHRYHDNIDGYECVGQANLEPKQNAWLFAGDDMTNNVQLPNILAESGMAPGEGANLSNEDGSITYNIPEYCDQATRFFKSGLYKVMTIIEHDGNSVLPIGISKEVAGDEPGDWIVVDNFRLTYLGHAVVDGVEDVKVAPETEDNRIFNLQGMEVKNANTPGIYIRNGKKFIVR